MEVRARLQPYDTPYVELIVCGAETPEEVMQAHGVPKIGTDCDALEVRPLQQDVWVVRINKADLYEGHWHWQHPSIVQG